MLSDILGLRKSKEALEKMQREIEELKGNLNERNEMKKFTCKVCDESFQMDEDSAKICPYCGTPGGPIENEECQHDWSNPINGRCPWCRERKNGHQYERTKVN